MVETTERTYTRDGRTIWYHYGRPDDAVVALCDDEEYAEMIVAALSAYIGEGVSAVPEMNDLRAEIDRLTRENADLRDGARRKQELFEAAERRALLYERAILGMARRISKTGLARVVPPDERTEPEPPAPDTPPRQSTSDVDSRVHADAVRERNELAATLNGIIVDLYRIVRENPTCAPGARWVLRRAGYAT